MPSENKSCIFLDSASGTTYSFQRPNNCSPAADDTSGSATAKVRSYVDLDGGRALRELTLVLLRREAKHQTSRVKNRLRSEASITDLGFETMRKF